ncbi:MAG TPA: hypothetical protein VL832_22755 [Puia sp.]|jgi:hypothetical protein|nr:hypothetical protein [Puia sp.]
MKLQRLIFVFFLLIPAAVFSQTPKDSAFSLLINSSISFTHANDPHMNRWMAKYGYPAEPHVPASLNLEIAAIPVASRLMYSLKLSTIISGKNLSSFNLLAGLYEAIIKTRQFLLLAGIGAGYHRDIITLNGDMPADYRELATQYNRQLSLRRAGLFVEPAARVFWFPLSYRSWQLGLFGGLGFDMDFNSQWRLGYYDNRHGAYNHFIKLKKPSDQQRVSEYGLAYNGGVSLHFQLH